MIARLRLPRRARAALIAVLLLAPATAGATVMKFMSVEELSRASTDVVRGTVLGQTSRWSEGNKGILTYVDILIQERIRGNRPLPEVVQLVHPGGELDGRRMLIVGGPSYRDGEEAIFFLAPYSNDPGEEDHVVQIGGRMGKMPVVDDEDGRGRFVVRELAGTEFAEFVPGDPAGLEIRPGGPGREDPRMTLDELRTLVRNAQRAVPAAGGDRP